MDEGTPGDRVPDCETLNTAVAIMKGRLIAVNAKEASELCAKLDYRKAAACSYTQTQTPMWAGGSRGAA